MTWLDWCRRLNIISKRDISSRLSIKKTLGGSALFKLWMRLGLQSLWLGHKSWALNFWVAVFRRFEAVASVSNIISLCGLNQTLAFRWVSMLKSFLNFFKQYSFVLRWALLQHSHVFVHMSAIISAFLREVQLFAQIAFEEFSLIYLNTAGIF